jgi:ArsR family transcriptional regulator
LEAVPQSIAEMAETLKLLSDKTRLTIMALLKEREMCVCDIVELLETTQPNISQHLKKLKTGGIVNETRRSQWVYYSLNIDDKPYLKEILDQLPSMKDRIQSLGSNSCC